MRCYRFAVDVHFPDFPKAEHLSTRLLSICTPSSERGPLKPFGVVESGYLSGWWAVGVLYRFCPFWKSVPYQIRACAHWSCPLLSASQTTSMGVFPGVFFGFSRQRFAVDTTQVFPLLG